MATSYHRVRLMEATKSRLRASTPADWSTWPIAWPSWPWAWPWEVGRLELAAQARNDHRDRGLGLAGQQPEEDHADDRHAERAADLLGGREHAGGRAGAAAADAREDHVEQRRDGEAEAEAAHHQGGQELTGMDDFAVAADRRHHREHAGDQQQAAEA